MFNSDSAAPGIRVFLLDLKPGEIQQVLQISDRVKVATHWVNRPILCDLTESCSLCKKLGPAKTQAYWYADLGRKNERPLGVVFVCMMFDLYDAIEGTPEIGRLIELKRTKRARSPIEGKWNGTCGVKRAVSQIEVMNAIAKLFNLPAIHIGESLRDYTERIMPIVKNKCDLAADLSIRA